MSDFSLLSTLRLARVRAFLTDFDGTLTTGGELRAQTLGALEALRDVGLPAVIVTGRPAGWGEMMARTFPVHGVISENGGVWHARAARTGKLTKGYAEGRERKRNRSFLEAAVAEVLAEVKGARLSTDSPYTEVDLAIDYNEEVKLGEAAAGRIEAACRKRGLQAVRSSVHVNAWVGAFDKRTAARRYLKSQLGIDARGAGASCIYLGDSLNDAPLFAAFALSVGVGNVRDVWDRLDAQPKFVTEAREGEGALQVMEALVRARSQGGKRTGS
jgi:HAD superfamily hydrolase (TIGR01484 family)